MNDLQKAVDFLRPISQFQELTEELEATLAEKVRSLPETDIEKTERVIGEIAALQEVLDIFTGEV